MAENFDFLKNPLKDSSDVQKTFGDIAKTLFEKYCINCNGTKYYFAEIEFYYYDKKNIELPENKNWQGVTYHRKAEAGDCFYHLSGCDVCFCSILDDSGKTMRKGGGILIRSIVNEKKNEMTVGPLNCVNKMLNSCGKGSVPFLDKINGERQVDLHQTYRYLGADDFKLIGEQKNKDGKLNLAFYDHGIDVHIWNIARPSYYSSRFKYDSNK